MVTPVVMTSMGSIAIRKVVTVVLVRWLEVRRRLTSSSQSADDTRVEKIPKVWEKFLKNSWVKSIANMAEPDLAT